MDLFNKARLSVQAVSKDEWEHIMRLEEKDKGPSEPEDDEGAK